MRKNEKGITLIALVITILLLIILASVTVYSGKSVVESSKLTVFTTEMKIMQTKVNELYEKVKNGEVDKDSIGYPLNYNPDILSQAIDVFEEIGITEMTGYRYFSKTTLDELGIEGVNQEFFVNIEKRDVISYKGFTYDNVKYYTLIQLPDGLYNVEYKPEVVEKPTFDVIYEEISENKYRVKIENIKYDGYIEKWTVAYQEEGKEYWKNTENMSFVLDKQGEYNIKIFNGDVVSDIKNISIQTEEVVN